MHWFNLEFTLFLSKMHKMLIDTIQFMLYNRDTDRDYVQKSTQKI